MDELIVPGLLRRGADPLAVAEVRHDYPETLLVGPLRRIRRRHPAVKTGSYPGRPMVVRFIGDRREVDAAASELRGVLADLAADPSAVTVREAWQRSPAWKAGC